ncbi:MAG: CDP-glycerol glycerophosphotransferase family protein [Lachnospiraceae bacterium]|nr:CDP-glycerol glycerophosphotransferase family protein [Lachnospiraceae bacterium]
MIFADAHHAEMPFSMRRMYEAVSGLVTPQSSSVREESGPQVSTSSAREQGGPQVSTSSAREQGGPQIFSSNARDQSGAQVSSPTAREQGELQVSSPSAREQSGSSRDAADGEKNGALRIEMFVTDFDQLSFFAMAKYLLRFMRRYAVAEYVFICDYFLPVSSCRKRPQTKVVQLWHSCGLMKKIAYDTGEDIPKGYRGNMFGNYTYLTLSAEACVPVHEHALRLSREHIRATGISRTDYYFDESWNKQCQENFYRQHPEACGKKIAVWAPTFRGNAAAPRLEGLDAVRHAAAALHEEWYFILKAHPHVDRHDTVSNCTIPTEELLPVADALITDYSSVLFDWLLYQKPSVLFAPDLEDYESARGFYIDYRSIPFPLAQTEEELIRAIQESAQDHPANFCEGAVETGREALSENATVTDHEKTWKDVADADHGKALKNAVDTGRETLSENAMAADQGRTSGQRVYCDMEIAHFRETYVGACDGHATERILELIGLG